MFIVINAFLDLQDAEYLYDVGDAYPREGLEPSEERIKELLGSDNLQGQPMIKAVKTVPADKKPEESADSELSKEDAEETSDTPETEEEDSKK
jgi:hypothetical protein|nr:MAG TPA: hypothetical protein [Caudoviricetes sp.]DAO32586.1 MAG TPA: hypothetical protein [Caudoviricetes sp.]DAU30496.1 MAG TPA: hypothetical protein [Caudoviricetes sp.]DAX90990.1 MAG TPA: hypothetical protein [Caudoviricetes sp.]